MPEKDVKLLFNLETEGHQDRILALISKATSIECVVAFAKMSGWSQIADAIEATLKKKGALARFTVGLSFFQTEPDFLHSLLQLSKNYPNLQIFVGDTAQTFHPKIYAFDSGKKSTVIIGSANLTWGGFANNYETSAEIKDADGKLIAEIRGYVDALINEKVITPVTQAIVDDYRRKFEINKIHQGVAARKAANAIAKTDFDTDTLQTALNLLREDKTESGFDAIVAMRRERYRQANLVIQDLTQHPPTTAHKFIERYEALIAQFSSGGLQRAKTRIATNYRHFLTALSEVQQHGQSTPLVAFDVLAEYFEDISGAGINVLTEILLTINSDRFANMNKNAVSGMERANITLFPARPLKTNVDGEKYSSYCAEAKRLRENLGLRDFIELDTLFNHLYWN